MDDQDQYRLEPLRMSAEAAPEAPAEPTPSATAPPAEARPGSKHPVPVTACTSPDDSRALAAGVRPKGSPAEWMFVRLSRMIEDFERGLSPEEEVGAAIVGAPGEGAFHVDDIGFWGPDLIMFYGKNMHGRRVRLIQHYEQMSILLTALPRAEEKPARRIGFALRARLEEAAAADAPPPAATEPATGAPAEARSRAERP